MTYYLLSLDIQKKREREANDMLFSVIGYTKKKRENVLFFPLT